GSGERSTLSWVDKNGGREPMTAGALPYSSAPGSPDGTRVGVEIPSRDGGDIHIYDLARKGLARLTSSPTHGRYPLWTPDSQRLVFYSDAAGGGLYSMAADGTGALKRLTTARSLQRPSSWADGGRTLVFEEGTHDDMRSSSISVLSLAGQRDAPPLVQTAAKEWAPADATSGC